MIEKSIWQRFLRRVQSFSESEGKKLGVSIVHITLIMKDDTLIGWKAPEVIHLEPRCNDDDLVRLLGALKTE